MEKIATEPSIVLEALKILTTAGHLASPEKAPVMNDAEGSFDGLLESRVLTLKATLSDDKKFCLLNHAMQKKSGAIEDAYDIKWKFVMTCLQLLEILLSSLEDVNKHCPSKSSGQTISPSVLGVSQQKIVLSALQFIVCLGICPNLQAGVGVPLQKRTGYGYLISVATSEKISSTEKNRQLFICAKTLLSCIIQPSLGSLILSRHLGDLLAVLLQICFGSSQSGLKKGSPNISPQTTHDRVPAAIDEKQSQMENPSQNTTQSEIGCFKAEIEFCDEKLKNLLERVYQPLLVRELLILQGGPARKKAGSSSPPLPQSPVWLRGACGRLLSDILMKPQGVQHILRGMLDGSSGDSSSFDWRKCDAVAMVISNCPMKASSIEAYYRQVSPQILALLQCPDRSVARQFLRVACSTINAMSKHQPALAERFLLQPFLKPLYACTEEIESPSDRQLVVATEEEITSCIENIHKICVSGSEPQTAILNSLFPISPVIFQLYCAAQRSVTHLRSACHEILVTLSKQLDREQAMSCFKVFAFSPNYGNSNTDSYMKQMHPNVTFAPGMKGGLVAVTTSMNDGDLNADNKGDACIQGLVALLKDLQVDGLAGEFFLYSLTKLTAIIADQTSGPRDMPSSSPSVGQELLDIELKQRRDVAAVQMQIQTLNLLATICESLGPSCLKSSKHVLEFVKVTLERCVEVCRETNDDLFELFETETLTMAMGLLTAMLAGGLEITDEDRCKMNELLPLFEQIATSHPDLSVKEMAADIRVAIATHGVVWSELLKMSSKNVGAAVKQVKVNRTVNAGTDIIKSKPKIEVISEEKMIKRETTETTAADNKSNDALKDGISEQTGASSVTTQDMQKSKLREAFEELCDPHIPVRGHALITLTKLVQAQDTETLEKQDTVLKIFLENLSHDDTYLYLNSVNGLVALANIFPDIIIPKLATLFADFNRTNKDVTLRIKLGECLVKASRNLGDMIPKYRNVLLPAILSGSRDEDHLVRASSMSNLGELCKLLRFSLGNVINEIFQCCSSLLKSDSEPEVRKAACLVITMLLQGSAQDTIQMLGSVLRDVYRLLKLLRSTEQDEGVLFHVHLATDELDTIMKDYLFPKQTLTKKIHVLDPLGNDFS